MMGRRIFITLLAASGLLSWAGCAQEGGPRELTVDELGAMLDGDTPVAIFDANGRKVRAEYGIIPGAKLLDSAGSYDVDRLPDDRATPCVFYCSSTWCSAARTAALRAQSAGYADVAVLPVGIKGWKAAGRPTESM